MPTLPQIRAADHLMLQHALAKPSTELQAGSLLHTNVWVGEGCIDVAGPGLQQVGIPQRQVAHCNDEVAALPSLNLPARHMLSLCLVLRWWTKKHLLG